MSLYTYEVLINTRSDADDSTIGMYSGVFKVIQATVSGITATSGIILLNGISNWTDSVDVTEGGNVADSGQCSLSLNNTDGLNEKLAAAGVSFIGCLFGLYRCDTDTGATVVWQGRVSSIDVDSAAIKISAIGLKQGRVSQLLTQIDAVKYPYVDTELIGTFIPASFGTLLKAKMIRTDSAVIPFVVNGSVETPNGSDLPFYQTIFSSTSTGIGYNFRTPAVDVDYGDIQDFPIVAPSTSANVVTYTIRIAPDGIGEWYLTTAPVTSGTIVFSDADTDYLVGKYLMVTDGKGKGSGRLIASASVNIDDNPCLLNITIAASNYFTDSDGNQEQLQANSETTPVDNDSWIEVQDIKKAYQADSFACYAFLDAGGGVV